MSGKLSQPVETSVEAIERFVQEHNITTDAMLRIVLDAFDEGVAWAVARAKEQGVRVHLEREETVIIMPVSAHTKGDPK